MDELNDKPKKRGTQKKDPSELKGTLSLTLTPVEEENLRDMARQKRLSPSRYVVLKLKLGTYKKTDNTDK